MSVLITMSNMMPYGKLFFLIWLQRTQSEFYILQHDLNNNHSLHDLIQFAYLVSEHVQLTSLNNLYWKFYVNVA